MSLRTMGKDVRAAYDFFDRRRARNRPFDEGDEQNIHTWMRSVTEWIEQQDARRHTDYEGE